MTFLGYEQFLEDWKPHQFAGEAIFKWRCLSRVQIAVAGPAMVRLLVQLEFDCNGWCNLCSPGVGVDFYAHTKECALDAALTAAGLPDQASRDKLRELIESRSG